MNPLYYLYLLIFLSGFSIISCAQTQFSDKDARNSYNESVKEMYEISVLSAHFPSSWENDEKRSRNLWTSYYDECVEGTYYRCVAFFSDVFDDILIDSLEKMSYMDKSLFLENSVLKFNEDFCEKSEYYSTAFDSLRPPIYDFRDAIFHLGTAVDSNKKYLEYEILPSDLMVYVIDAKSGNFWKNKEAAELEPRPGLPENWKHGYSRGVAISRSCKRVCWWTMAW